MKHEADIFAEIHRYNLEKLLDKWKGALVNQTTLNAIEKAVEQYLLGYAVDGDPAMEAHLLSTSMDIEEGRLRVRLIPKVIDESYFADRTKRKPISDELERCNCREVRGSAHDGHYCCGWCPACDVPRFACGHRR